MEKTLTFQPCFNPTKAPVLIPFAKQNKAVEKVGKNGGGRESPICCVGTKNGHSHFPQGKRQDCTGQVNPRSSQPSSLPRPRRKYAHYGQMVRALHCCTESHTQASIWGPKRCLQYHRRLHLKAPSSTHITHDFDIERSAVLGTGDGVVFTE